MVEDGLAAKLAGARTSATAPSRTPISTRSRPTPRNVSRSGAAARRFPICVGTGGGVPRVPSIRPSGHGGCFQLSGSGRPCRRRRRDGPGAHRARPDPAIRVGLPGRVRALAARGLAALRTMQDEGSRWPIVLAAQWMSEIEGTELLAEVGRLHPHAKRGLLIDWGAWGHPPTAEAIFQGDGAAPHGLLPDEAPPGVRRAVPPHGRRVPPRVVPSAIAGARTRSRWWRASGRCAGTSCTACWLETASRTPFFRATRKAGRRALAEAGSRGGEAPVAIMHDGRVLVDPTRSSSQRPSG